MNERMRGANRRGGGFRTARTLIHVLLVLATGAVAACSPLDDAMVAVFGRSMRDQPSLDPYENPLPAPENSVPFAAANFPPAADRMNLGQAEPGEFPPPMTLQDLGQRTEVVTGLENPVPADEASLARGQELYDRYCAVCHGEEGIGADAYIADRHPMLPAFDLAGERVQGYTDGYIYAIIRLGRGLMPSYAHAVGHYDRWHVVNYVRQLQAEFGGADAADEGAAGAGDG